MLTRISRKWDERFLRLAQHVAEWSKDPSTKVGAVLVSPDRSQIIVGYNGFPRGVFDNPQLLGNREEKYQRIVHAELNAILNCPSRPIGWTLYITPLPPCAECTKAIIQSGVQRIVINPEKAGNKKWEEHWTISVEMLNQAGVEFENLNV